MRLPRFVQYWRVARRFERKSKLSQGSGSRSAATPAPGCQSASRGGLTASTQGSAPADVLPLPSAGVSIADVRDGVAPVPSRATAEPGLERLALPDEVVGAGASSAVRGSGPARPSGSRTALGAPLGTPHNPSPVRCTTRTGHPTP